MRVIAGSLGGRHFVAPKGRRTHPMSEKARGGLFSALGDIEGLSVLDAFAGSGALSFEAISRGAKRAIAIDIDNNATNIINDSANKLNIDHKIKAIKANSSSWSDNNPEAKFDIIICDPPFDQFKIPLIEKLTRHLVKNGVFIVNMPGSDEVFELDYLKMIKSKNYGDNTLVFYKSI
jgi:16S rRNA (guanine966-N2)-methyltransferase